MLGKLIKHEFKATYRTFVPIYIGLVILTGAACLFLELLRKFDQTALVVGSGFGMIIVVLGMIFVFLSPWIFLSMRFYRTTATREAYLTFTVPADTKIILLAKFIATYVWTVLTVILGYVSVAILVVSNKGGNFWDILTFVFDNTTGGLIALQIISFLVSFASSVLHIFASVSLGQLVRDHRVIASLAFYAALYTVHQIVSVLVLLPWMFTELTTEGAPETSGFSVGITSNVNTSTNSESIQLFLITIVINLIFSAAFYVLSNFLLKKKLNLL
ncbi:MAG: hypothetical protein NC293_00570 [Roseburia sp.]|nr:hypothetical protein [Roseburia sp.]